MDEGRKRARVMAAILTVLTWKEPTICSAAQREGAEATRTLLSTLRIRPGVVNLPVPFAGEDAAYKDAMTRLGDAAAFASAIGCPRMITVLPPSSATPKPEFRRLLNDRVSAIAEVLQRSQVRLGLEFLGPLHFRTRQPHEFIWRTFTFCSESPNMGRRSSETSP